MEKEKHTTEHFSHYETKETKVRYTAAIKVFNI